MTDVAGSATGTASSSVGLRITGATVATPKGPQRAELRVVAGRIASPDPMPTSADVGIDAQGLLIAPGFLDLQTNGAYGIDLTSELVEHPERLWQLAEHLPSQGVTAFLPTVVSSPSTALEGARRALLQRPADHLGAEPLGIHAEGPMLAPAKRGTHDPEHLRDPDVSLISTWSRADGVTLATVAPELPGAAEVIRELVAHGVIVSVGHTDATYEQVLAAFDAGARAGTHLFNAMSGWTAREPGAAGALLTDLRVTVGMIVDDVHLHPATVLAAWRLLGPERTMLVTDAIAAAGGSGGAAVLGGRPITVADGVVRDEQGSLAGSVLTLDRALRGLVATTGAETSEALRTVTSTPASLLGDQDRGHLGAGARADLVVLTHDLEVVATFVAGRLAAHPRPDLLDLPAEVKGT